MQWIAPSGPVYQAGTLSGNPLAVTAGIETLKQLKKPGLYDKLNQLAAALAEGLGTAAKRAGVPLAQTRVGSMLGAFFTQGPVVDYASAKRSNTEAYAKFFHRMLNKGVYLAPSQFEAAFLSTAHTMTAIDQTIAAARTAFRGL
ncbi:MAG: aspartate aminotransferase family protein, partial [Nitrospiraceae bacterium]